MSVETDRTSNRWVSIALCAVLVAAACILIRSAWVSLDWLMEIDAPLLHYMAFAVDSGVVPYRDLFVTSFPGAILFHLAVIRTVGMGDEAFMLLNLLWLAAVMLATWTALAPLGRRVAACGGILFGLIYLHGGSYIALQRDAITILPIACAASLSLAERWRTSRRALLIGIAFGLAATIKPHAAMGLPFVLVFGAFPERGWPAVARRAMWAAFGFALPLLAMFGWLASSGGWDAFFAMVSDYLPLHLELSGHHTELVGPERWIHLFRRTIDFGPESAWLLAAIPGALIIMTVRSMPERTRRTLRLFGVLAVVYAFYPAISGQFWNYHWLPFEYFLAQLAAFCLLDPPALRRNTALRLLPAILLAATLYTSEASMVSGPPSAPTPEELASNKRLSKRTAYHHRVSEISAFLKSELEPGDRVQPLDWVAGGVHAMLDARAQIATPFVSDYHFYHHVDHPVVRGLRDRFMQELRATPPRFIVELLNVPHPKGAGSGDFAELSRWISRNYRAAKKGPNWVIWEHDAED